MEIELNDFRIETPNIVYDYDYPYNLQPEPIPEDVDAEEIESEEDTDNPIEINEEQEQESTIPEKSSSDEYEEIEWEYPPFVPDDLIVPNDFKDDKSELEWYRDNYYKALDYYKSDDMRDQIASQYKNTLMEVEKNVEGLKAVEQLFQGHPEIAIKVYAPDYLAQKGYPGQITDEEIQGLIGDYLTKEFGEDFLERYNKEEAAKNPNSISGKMLARHEQLLDWANKENARLKQVYEANKPASAEDMRKAILAEYDSDFKNYLTQEEFQEYVPKALERLSKVTLADAHLLVYQDDYLRAMYEKGVKDGKAGVVRNIEKAGTKNISKVSHTQKKNDEPPQEFNRLGSSIDNIYNKLIKG